MPPRVRLSLTSLIVVLGAAVAYPQETPIHPADVPVKATDKSETASSTPSPTEVYRAYLNAVKKSDLEAAKGCWTIAGDDSCGASNVVVGMWVAFHRFNAAISNAGLDAQQFGDGFARRDCTDEAIDRTLERLKESTFAISGDRAKLTIRWNEDDGFPNEVFCFGHEPISFRKIPAGWKIDANVMCDLEKPQDFFACTWGEAFRSQMTMANEAAAGLESGTLKTATDVVQVFEKHIGSLEGRIPLTRTVVYLEDSPARYLRIKKGDPNVVTLAGEQLPHRKDIPHPRRIEGILPTILREMYGKDDPRLIVETRNTKGYEVVYDPADTRALEIVATQLGMIVIEETREFPVARLTVAKDGHHLKKAEALEQPQGHRGDMDRTSVATDRHRVWPQPLQDVTMDELSRFLESRFGTTVVNMTGLTGRYSLELSDESVKVGPQTAGVTHALDQTGLEVHWERTSTKVLVVRDR